MVEHMWGEEGVDWQAINDAASWMPYFMRKWGRFTVHGKEKYGVVRLEFLYMGFNLHKLIFPDYIFRHRLFPEWLWNIDQCLEYRTPVYKYLFNWWLVPYQVWIYKLAYKKAVKKWPHIKKEIMSEYDWNGVTL